jgi:radical SAM protein with 4Fe4S-binding SPASM domain
MVVLSWPAIYALELTATCNNHCPGCSNVYAADRTPPPLPASAWETWLASLAPEAVQIRLTGGEPTLHPEFYRILEAATAYDAWVTVFTNGRWRHPRQLARRLRDWPNLSGLLVSLHGARAASHEVFSRVPGSFAETIANIRLAVDAGLPVALSTIITHASWNELEAVVELGQTLGVRHVAFNRYLGGPLPGIEPTPAEMRAAVTHIEALIQSGAPVKYGIGMPQCYALNSSEGCLAGVAYASIDPWGHVRPCAHSPTVVGSLQTESMPEIWRGPAMDAWRALMPTECTTCAAYPACHGGCRAMQELRSNGRDPLRGAPLRDYAPAPAVHELPADARPRILARLRPEPFGYALLGQGQVVPVHGDALGVVQACNGNATFAELATRFGQEELDLLGELWELSMLGLA